MKNALCSERFRRFFTGIDQMDLSIENLMAVIKENIPIIADDAELGKFIIKFCSPPSPIEEGYDVEFEVYKNDYGFSEEKLVHVFSTPGGGTVTFTAHPAQGVIWDKEDQENIMFLFNNTFAICGRARLSDIVKKSLSRDLFTGLINSNGYIAAGNRLAAEGRLHEYTAAYINLKNFKYINGQMGNNYGDAVIKEYAVALSKIVGKNGLTARLGGDNFCVLIRQELTDDLLEFISGADLEIESEGLKSRFCIQARAGIYEIKENDTMPHVMNCISAAISNVRRKPNGFTETFTPEFLYKIMHEQEITSSFPSALKNKEFLVYFQPKINLDTKEICGCEALVRWQKNGKIVPPMNFIPLFERNGNVRALDFYMLDNVCRSICDWKEKGLEPVTVSVNFSKTHLHNPYIAEDILAVIKKHRVDSRYIEIEMTEMSDYNDYEAFRTLVNKLKTNGVMTSIDDFGTGYSSLNLLTDFMFDIVKLDKSFLDNTMRKNSKTDEIVVRNIIRMIKELNMTTIAEGVETAEQAEFLKDIGCNMVQGFLFDKPLPENEFINRLETRFYGSVV